MDSYSQQTLNLDDQIISQTYFRGYDNSNIQWVVYMSV